MALAGAEGASGGRDRSGFGRASKARRGDRPPIPAAGDRQDNQDGIPATTPSRTLTDLADTLPPRQLERALDEAAYLRLDLAGLRPRHGRRGSGLLKSALQQHDPGTTRTRSELEERMLSLCGSRRLPAPEVNAVVEGHEVDFVWRRKRLIVETDGWHAHGTRGAFERDRRRDAELLAAGWRVLRISHARLELEPYWVAARLAGALGA